MAIGDFVVGTIIAVGDLIFQPAGTNVIMVTNFANYVGDGMFTNGVLTNAYFLNATGTNYRSNGNTNSKVFINNATYLRLINGGYEKCFSGVQVA